MAIIHKVEPAAKHTCRPPYDPPPETLYGIGTVWQCDVCGRKAKLVYDERVHGYCWQGQ